MGMTIDEQIDGLRKAAVICTSVFAYDCQGYIKEAIDTLCKYHQLQADYENRLKADLVAMLEEIDLEMSEQSFGIQTEPWEVVEELRKKIIQQKINALKGDSDGA